MDVVGAHPVRQGDVFLVSLDPTMGRDIPKTRPCVIISPDELNGHLRTFIVAPLTTGTHPYPFRIPCRFAGKSGFVVLDQLRTVDRARLAGRAGRLSPATLLRTLDVLQDMFAPASAR
ncbi:MAG: type II toxin-antitoxin system PemK/MazF family toxin [Gemmatimonadales bacterium]